MRALIRRAASRALLIVFVASAACSAPEESGGCGQRQYAVVAHEDDDLLFLSPDLKRSFAAGQCLTTIYLTAGDAGMEEVYWRGREAGEKDAYEAMLGVPGPWTTTQDTVAGKIVTRAAAGPDRQVELVFLRIPDGTNGSGTGRYGNVSLARLFAETVDRLETVDGASHYSRADLVAVLRALVDPRTATGVFTLDPDPPGQADHSDHINSARFALEALNGPGLPAPASYRGYSVKLEAPNLSVADAAEKERVFRAYAVHDPKLCPDPSQCAFDSFYAAFFARLYRE